MRVTQTATSPLEMKPDDFLSD